MRLDKFLTEVQIGSRSQVKDYIKKGRISVNQVTVLKPEAQIKENSDTVTFDGKELQYSQFHYYMLHKPAGVITAVKDDMDVTVMSLLPRDAGRNLSPVGRLDKDTEGLLLITNDGELSQDDDCHPRNMLPRLIMWSVEVVYQNRNWKCLEKA